MEDALGVAVRGLAAESRCDSHSCLWVAEPIGGRHERSGPPSIAVRHQGNQSQSLDHCRLAGIVRADKDSDVSHRDDVVVEAAEVPKPQLY